MKVTITVSNSSEKAGKIVLFGARHNFIALNYGNLINKRLECVEFDEDYKKCVGISSDSEERSTYSAFLMDCVKFNLRVQRINGEQLKRKIKGSDPVEYELINFNTFNPYLEQYELDIPVGETKIEVELRSIESLM